MCRSFGRVSWHRVARLLESIGKGTVSRQSETVRISVCNGLPQLVFEKRSAAGMEETHQLVFGPFRLDLGAKRLWREQREITLQPQPLAVLHYLLEHAGRVVTKEELLREVWAGTYVTRTALKVCIRAIRVALGDNVAMPCYLETVGRLGYRFIAPLAVA